ncbi:MAG: tRNA (guanosine(37)-N1)-methyltransferase TrmD [Patescibacteria group bacterium]
MKKFIIVSLFPEIFEGFLNSSLIKRARQKKILNIEIVNLRQFGLGVHQQVDDCPYGGGPGMILKVDVLDKAIKSIKQKNPISKVILLDPKGKIFTQPKAKQLSTDPQNLVFVCGRYEGFDARTDQLVDEKISLGKFILGGGEIASMAILEATARLLPNFLGKNESLKNESFNENNLEYPQYTRPEIYKNMKVPAILLSGNHQKIIKWQEEHSKIDK